MFDKLRYTSASFFAVIITLVSFVGMALLIAPSSYRKTVDIEVVDFSTIKDTKAPDVTKKIEKKLPPKKQEVAQKPIAPPISVSTPWTRTEIELPQGAVNTNLESISSDMLSIINPVEGDGFGPNDRGLMSTLAIQPMYPQKELLNKTEGWVEVHFTVNEFGNVINASVVDSQPKRVFNSAALKAIKKSKFKPLIVDGKAISQTATQIYEFKIDKN